MNKLRKLFLSIFAAIQLGIVLYLAFSGERLATAFPQILPEQLKQAIFTKEMHLAGV